MNFEDINAIKKQSVRGLLRKRAKKYTEAQSSSEEEEHGKKTHKKRKVMKETLSDAFRFIMNKEIVEAPFDESAAAVAP